MFARQICRFGRCLAVRSHRLSSSVVRPISVLSPPVHSPVFVCPSVCLSTGSQAAANVVSIQDDSDFHTRVRESSSPVIIQFHATWCAPCKLLKPRLEKAVMNKKGLLLAAVDVDQLPDVSMEFKVSAVPCVFAYHNGNVVDSFVGLKEESGVKDFVESFAEKCGV